MVFRASCFSDSCFFPVSLALNSPLCNCEAIVTGDNIRHTLSLGEISGTNTTLQRMLFYHFRRLCWLPELWLTKTPPYLRDPTRHLVVNGGPVPLFLCLLSWLIKSITWNTHIFSKMSSSVGRKVTIAGLPVPTVAKLQRVNNSRY